MAIETGAEKASQQLSDRDGAVRGIDTLFRNWGASPVGDAKTELQRSVLDNDITILDAGMGTRKTTVGMPLALQAMLGRYPNTRMIATEPRKYLVHQAANDIGGQVGNEYVHYYHEGRVPSFTSRLEVTVPDSLQNELNRDELLTKYNAVFIDEAHNVDGLLALLPDLKRAASARAGTDNPLKLIFASGTINAQAFIDYFKKGTELKVNHLRVEGTMHHLTSKYLPEEEEDIAPEDIPQKSAEKVIQILTDPDEHPGDILTFLPGRSGIREAERLLTEYKLQHNRDDIEIIKVLGGAESKESMELINRDSDKRRIYLATTVVQEGANIKKLRHVVVCGKMNTSIYNPETGLSFLETIDLGRDDADQQAKRAPREQDGTAHFLIKQSKYDSLESHVDVPADLTHQVLMLKNKRNVDIYNYDYAKAPSRENLQAAERTLQQLGALDAGMRITPIGEKMLAEETDPRFARMLVEASRPREGDTAEKLKNRRNAVAILIGLMSSNTPVFFKQLTSDMRYDRSDFITALRVWKASYNNLIREADPAQRERYIQTMRSQGINAAAFLSADSTRRDLTDDREKYAPELDLSDESVQSIMEAVLAGSVPWIFRYNEGQYELESGSDVVFETARGSAFARWHPKEIVSAKFRQDRKTGNIINEMSQVLDEDMLKKVTLEYYELLNRQATREELRQPEKVAEQEGVREEPGEQFDRKQRESFPSHYTRTQEEPTRRPRQQAEAPRTLWERFKSYWKKKFQSLKELWLRFLRFLSGRK